MKQDTLCWKCAKCCGKCSWSNGTFTPVEGWEATPVIINSYEDIPSYVVKSCPQFEEDNLQCKLLTTDELAEKLGISRRSLFRKYTLEEIEALKIKLYWEGKNERLER